MTFQPKLRLLRVGLISRGVYPRLVGGREVFIRLLVKGLTAEGCDVILVSENGSGMEIEGVCEVSIPTPGVGGIDLIAYSAGFVVRGLPALRKVDVLHVHSPGANVVLGAIAAQILQIPLVVTVHSMAAVGSRWMWVLRHADVLVAVSPTLGNQLVEAGITRERIRIIPAASSHPHPRETRYAIRARFGFQPEDVVFVYHGRLVPGKGLDELAESFSTLAGRRAKLLVLGSGPLNSVLQSRLRASRAGSQAFLIGRIPHEEIWDYLLAADVAVLPSQSEGSPLALFEALSVGLPVLASDAPGLRDFVKNGDNGILVPARSPPDLRRAMELLTQDGDLRQRLAEGARQSADRYSIEECTDRHLELYQSLVQSR